ncbi:CCA tRNA nucleotidyltransferase, mitochondrial [Coemansia sp. RSA 1822]|nr:CCA tRNA nucleotidyltransferase, mitochondrial [Coemansia sp. RSA 1853]KAJ2560585.1 CCA tRNA nucleotidyltransferase, mitochondrial [Coemansia sp. RSA 1822]
MDTGHSPSKRQLTSMAKIALTEKEHEICSLLNNVADHIHTTTNQQLTLRIAGGWVRDKLLGLASHDIDIAVDHMSGYTLAHHVTTYMQTHSLATSSVGKINSNPERSKHLETATTKVLGHLVDFVHLRSETYKEDSRIPLVEFGTPEEDARRRDITINALFYNLQTREVEDFTGRGLKDLQEGVVRTPMDAEQTFRDDPLRVLRVLRFASRFGYEIDRETARAMHRVEVRQDLDKKISRERVGVEVEKMAAGERPLLAVQLILRFNLFECVFRAPPRDMWTNDVAVDAAAAESVSRCMLRVLDGALLHAHIPSQYDVTLRDRRALILASYVFPFHAAVAADRKRQAPVALLVVRDGLKLPTNDADTVAAVHTLAPRITEMAALCCAGPVERNTLGHLVRDAGARWVIATLFAAAVELHNGKSADQVVATFSAFMGAVKDAELEDAYKMKHIVNGRDVATLLKCRTGPGIKPVLDRVMDWQLAHPRGTHDECREFIVKEIAPHMPL